jgi:FKBP-type peptidyl-prolyl cis-trans isomerase FkpA
VVSFAWHHTRKGDIVFKDRTSATVIILAVIALVIMVAGLLVSSQNRAQLAQQTAQVQTQQAPTNAIFTQAAIDQQTLQANMNQTSTQVASVSLATSIALATSAAGADIQTTDSGLQYRVIAEGTGPKPTASDTVTVNYRGIFPDGTEFDSSYSRNQPATFAINRVISGWTEGLQLMSVGSKYIFIIPPELGYGEQGYPPVIPSNATLIFEVELLDIPSQATPEATPEATTAPEITAEATPESARSEATAEATESS